MTASTSLGGLLVCSFAVSTAEAGGGGVGVGAGSDWDHIGPFNIFDDVNLQGEAGTLASAASPKANPDLIYAGGQNNGVSSGVLRTKDGTSPVPHWTRQSKGLWDTRVLGVWVHPDDPTGGHVFCGTHSGVYESKDFAETWTFRNDTTGWGNVMSFREGLIGGVKFVIANTGNGIGTLPLSGGTWQKIAAPGPIAPNAYISLVTTAGKTELLTCIGGWGGGKLYYAAFETATTATWTGPITPTGGQPIDCANAAVDPNDRDHFLYSEGGSYQSVWESHDCGKTVKLNPNHNTGVYFTMIDQLGWQYTATQAGAFVSTDKGATWNPYHVIMHSRTDNRTIDRVPHDYQNIVPEFRGDGVAFPSDQGLHIVNRSSFELISAVGDLHNTMSLSALISPSPTVPGSRTIVSNIWDWDVMFSRDDGATWSGWNSTEKSPGNCGEGGGGVAMGKSGHVIVFHGNRYWASSDSGHNFVEVHLTGNPTGGFAYVRQAGSRTEPTGAAFMLMTGTSQPVAVERRRAEHRPYRADAADPEYDDEHPDKDADELEREMKPRDVLAEAEADGDAAGDLYWGASTDFGTTFNFSLAPAALQGASGLAVDPTSPSSIFAWSGNSLAHSSDQGATWTDRTKAPGLEGGRFSKLLVKDSKTMFMLRSGLVPLRSQDGGASWQGLNATAALFKYGVTLDGSISWTGKTLMLTGNDKSAIGRGEYGTVVWRSTDDGDSWTDETGDLVTISVAAGVWYESDYYFVTLGEGICVKRNFDGN